MPQGMDFFNLILKDFAWLGNFLFLFIALIECIPFAGAAFPGGTLISIGAFLAAQGYFNVWDIFIFSFIGAILGDYLGFSLGRWGRPWMEKRHLIKPKLMAKSENLFKKYGSLGLVWGRFFGATRAIVPFSAGASKMKHRTFLLWNIISALVWAAFSVGVGYFSGNVVAELIHKWSQKLGLILLILVIIVLIYWVIKTHGRHLWLNFKKEGHIFMEKALAGRWYLKLDQRYPVISELTKTPKKEEKAFGFILIALILALLYILTLVL